MILWAQGDNRLILDGSLPEGVGPAIKRVIENSQALSKLMPVAEAMLAAGYFTEREMRMNAGPEQLLDLMVARLMKAQD